MSACMRFLYSSDQPAPGFCFAGVVDVGVDGVLSAVTRGARGATLSLRVGRGDVGFELLIDLWFGLVPQHWPLRLLSDKCDADMYSTSRARATSRRKSNPIPISEREVQGPTGD
jgi:hypothetical protein